MERPAVRLLLLVVLCATLTRVCAEGSEPPQEDTTGAEDSSTDSQCSPVQRRQDLQDTRLNAMDARFNRMESRFDNIEQTMSDTKEYLQTRMQAMEEKAEWALTAGNTHGQPPTVNLADFRPARISRVHGGCQDALTHGWTTSGVYRIRPDNTKTMDVYCEQRLDGGGWTVFQARKDGSVDFYRDWNDYKQGFGDLSGEFWLGNMNIHHLTKHNDQELRIELVSPEGQVQYVSYSHFSVDDEARNFTLNVTGYSGGSPPGDSMAIHNRRAFSTRDKDNDRYRKSCAEQGKGGWWYNECSAANLNGLYGSKKHNEGLNWETWHGNNLSMNATRMMIRKRP